MQVGLVLDIPEEANLQTESRVALAKGPGGGGTGRNCVLGGCYSAATETF